jgi:hypothetical protein
MEETIMQIDRSQLRHLRRRVTAGLSTVALTLTSVAIPSRAAAQSGCEMCGQWVTPCVKAPPVCPGATPQGASKRKHKAPTCDAKTERALEQQILREIKARNELWADDEKDLQDGADEIAQIIADALGELGPEGTRMELIHAVLEDLAAGATTPVLVAELISHGIGLALKASEIMQVWTEAHKRSDRAWADAERLDDKIDSALTALEKCRAGMTTSRLPDGPRVKWRPVGSQGAGDNPVDPAAVRALLAEDARIIAASRSYPTIAGAPPGPYHLAASSAMRRVTDSLRAVQRHLGLPATAGQASPAASAQGPVTDPSPAQRAALQRTRVGTAMLAASDAWDDAYRLSVAQVAHDRQVLALLAVRTTSAPGSSPGT